MDRLEALETLRRSEPAPRGDNHPGSDIDIMIEVDPEAHITVFDYVDIKEYIAGLFDGPVDIVRRDSLKAHIRPAVTTDAVYAF